MLKKNLAKILKNKKISILALARESHIPKSTIHSWLSGQTAVNLVQLQAVANVLEVGLYELAFGVNDPHVPREIDLEDIFAGDVRVSIKRIKGKKHLPVEGDK